MATFLDILLFSNPNRKRSKTYHQLQVIEKSIDFKELEVFLADLYQSNKDTGGRSIISLRIKIKMLFLQYLYNITDAFLEDHLLGNLDFQEFAGISIGEDVPDFTSHCRFKERLVKKNFLIPLFEKINHQLKQKKE